jgi:hypothetical protein
LSNYSKAKKDSQQIKSIKDKNLRILMYNKDILAKLIKSYSGYYKDLDVLSSRNSS